MCIACWISNSSTFRPPSLYVLHFICFSQQWFIPETLTDWFCNGDAMCFLALMKNRLKIYKHLRFSKETHTHTHTCSPQPFYSPAAASHSFDRHWSDTPAAASMLQRVLSWCEQTFPRYVCAKYKPEDVTLWHARRVEASYVSSNPDRGTYVKTTYSRIDQYKSELITWAACCIFTVTFYCFGPITAFCSETCVCWPSLAAFKAAQITQVVKLQKPLHTMDIGLYCIPCTQVQFRVHSETVELESKYCILPFQWLGTSNTIMDQLPPGNSYMLFILVKKDGN